LGLRLNRASPRFAVSVASAASAAGAASTAPVNCLLFRQRDSYPLLQPELAGSSPKLGWLNPCASALARLGRDRSHASREVKIQYARRTFGMSTEKARKPKKSSVGFEAHLRTMELPACEPATPASRESLPDRTPLPTSLQPHESLQPGAWSETPGLLWHSNPSLRVRGKSRAHALATSSLTD
jgi:hypothetical protein